MISEYVESSITTFLALDCEFKWTGWSYQVHIPLMGFLQDMSPLPCLSFFIILPVWKNAEEWRPVTVWHADWCKREICVAATSPKIILLDLNGSRITRKYFGTLLLFSEWVLQNQKCKLFCIKTSSNKDILKERCGRIVFLLFSQRQSATLMHTFVFGSLWL